MLSRLDNLKEKLLQKGSEEGNLTTSLYYLVKELKCLPEILGREFEVEYDKKGRIKRIRQLPMSIPTLMILLKEMETDYKRQEKDMKKSQRKGRRR
ncbi:hypothetical protein LCGC14_1554090 [marine sediment metagenome]|uniref:Uncharacterized protein n=1 Tax=marine sediment metagenome TaxID=412755 RepID=A0A0F9IPF8_9ZZZZ